MEINKIGSQTSGRGPADCFTATAKTPIAIQEQLDGKAVDWTEK